MHLEQILETENQRPPVPGQGFPSASNVSLAALLANHDIQSAPSFTKVTSSDVLSFFETLAYLSPRRSVRGSSSSNLRALKARRFAAEGKPERIAKSLAALNQEERIDLTPEEWRWVAEEPEIEEQF